MRQSFPTKTDVSDKLSTKKRRFLLMGNLLFFKLMN